MKGGGGAKICRMSLFVWAIVKLKHFTKALSGMFLSLFLQLPANYMFTFVVHLRNEWCKLT